jgi:hypothetical protein
VVSVTKLYIVSGSVKQIIRLVLKQLSDCFEDVRANNMVFDEYEVLAKIEGVVLPANLDVQGPVLS